MPATSPEKEFMFSKPSCATERLAASIYLFSSRHGLVVVIDKGSPDHKLDQVKIIVILLLPALNPGAHFSFNKWPL